MDVEIKQFPEMRAAAVRHVGPYNQVSQAFQRLSAVAGPAGLFQRPGALMIAIYHDDPGTTPPEQLRSDAAVTLADGMPIPAGLTEQRIKGGRYACTFHVGPYEQLGDAWMRFFGEWLPASGHRAAGTSYEVYLNTPADTPKEQLRTEMRLAIE
jgi:AraC family transcriptional regulator